MNMFDTNKLATVGAGKTLNLFLNLLTLALGHQAS